MNSNNIDEPQKPKVTLGQPGDLYHIFLNGDEVLPWKSRAFTLVEAMQEIPEIRKLATYKSLHMRVINPKCSWGVTKDVAAQPSKVLGPAITAVVGSPTPVGASTSTVSPLREAPVMPLPPLVIIESEVIPNEPTTAGDPDDGYGYPGYC